MSSFRLTERAADDIVALYVQGIEWFGPQQADSYVDDLQNCFQLLADNPRLGRAAPAAGRGIRRHEHRSHVIFYEEAGDGVMILAVAHRHQLRGLTF